MRLKYHKAILHDPAYYQDEAGKKYRRIAGGIGWPHSGEAGFALVIAESFDVRPIYTVLDGWENHNALKLLETCKAAELSYPVPCWYSNTTDRLMLNLLHEFNKGKETSEKIVVQGTPQAGEARNSGYYLPLVVELGQVGNKRLAVKDSKLLGLLQTLDPEKHFNRDISEFPALAALCYPLVYFLTYSGIVVRPKKPDLSKYGELSWQR